MTQPQNGPGSYTLYASGCRSSFTPLAGVLFTFPSRYSFTIGCQGVFSLIRWSGLIHAEFHVHRVTWDTPRGRSGFRAPGSHGLRPAFPCRYANPTRLPPRGPSTPERQVPPVWASPLSLATTHGITSFSSPGVTEMFHFTPSRLAGLCIHPRDAGRLIPAGSPIRKSTDQRLLVAPRGLSQLAASFIASWHQGIHRLHLVA
jgi:hypothetical protein